MPIAYDKMTNDRARPRGDPDPYFHILPLQLAAPHWHLTWTASSCCASSGASTPISSSGAPK